MSSLAKIGLASGRPLDEPNWHHYSLKERIGYLERCVEEPWFITRHHARVKKSLKMLGALVAAGIVLMVSLELGSLPESMIVARYETRVMRQHREGNASAQAFTTLGGLHFQRGKYEKARWALQRALELDPGHAEALNSLAWLYATCPDSRYRKPEKALDLAVKAAESAPMAHILDTLAESYHVNGMHAQAVQAGERALEKARFNVEYFRDQLARFREAVRSGDR